MSELRFRSYFFTVSQSGLKCQLDLLILEYINPLFLSEFFCSSPPIKISSHCQTYSSLHSNQGYLTKYNHPICSLKHLDQVEHLKSILIFLICLFRYSSELVLFHSFRRSNIAFIFDRYLDVILGLSNYCDRFYPKLSCIQFPLI